MKTIKTAMLKPIRRDIKIICGEVELKGKARKNFVMEEAATHAYNHLARASEPLDSTGKVRQLLEYSIGTEEKEHISILCLDNQHRMISWEQINSGSVTSGRVYPREVVKRSLELNAAAIILCHNHPSGSLKPSEADKRITGRIKHACDLMDIRLLDHWIVTANGLLSFSEEELI